jgi:AraC-like DNA-binding protein
VAPPEGGVPGVLLAIDGSQRVVGANQVARKSLLLDDRGLRAGLSLWTIFERDPNLFRRKDRTDVVTQLLLAGSSEGHPVLVTPPDPISGDPRYAALHTRPRLDSIDTLLKLPPPAPQAHGGLAPGAMRRVREYIEMHLSENIDLPTLAAVAGLSMHHFARQFKQSAGATPHQYLTKKRVEQAQGMLAQTDMSLSEIAYATGFSDQSHLARHFRYVVGTTPRQFRWAQR